MPVLLYSRRHCKAIILQLNICIYYILKKNKVKEYRPKKKKTQSERTVGTSATWEQVRAKAESHLHSKSGTWYHLAMSPCVPFLLHSLWWLFKTSLRRQPWGFPGGPVVKNSPCNAGDMGLIPGLETKIPCATELLSLHTQLEVHVPQQKIHMRT